MARYREDEREKAQSSARQKLIDAAIGEFAREGYANANINRISESAGYAKGTIYNYFKSKQGLMLAIIAELGATHLDYIAGQVLQAAGAEKRLERFFEAGFAFVETHPAEARLLVSTLYEPQAEFREPMGQAYLPMFGLVNKEILALGVAEGVFQPMNLMLNTTLIMTLYLGTCSQVDENGTPLLDPRAVSRFAYNALRNQA